MFNKEDSEKKTCMRFNCFLSLMHERAVPTGIDKSPEAVCAGR